jgi:hypothetical protein
LAWFFAKIALENEEGRKDSNLIAITKELEDVGYGGHVQTILVGNKVHATLSEIWDSQSKYTGGCQDNDKEDF